MTYTKIPNLTRCDWVPPNDKIYTHYHDKEWGRPIKCEKELFSKLIQEGQQAGLSWSTVHHKRQNLLLASIAADLKKRGFKFVGPVIIYAFMQAVGMINDHTLGCFANEVCKDLS